jgi:prepilin-type N-terminal cleavage/methylation domain-containing protein
VRARKTGGFTLVELMIVVIIVGVLAAVAVPVMSACKEKALHSEPLAVLAAVNSAGQLFFVETGMSCAGFSTLEHLSHTGFLDDVDLDGTYYRRTDYEDWQFDEKGMVTQVTVDTWKVTWDSEHNRYVFAK